VNSVPTVRHFSPCVPVLLAAAWLALPWAGATAQPTAGGMAAPTNLRVVMTSDASPTPARTADPAPAVSSTLTTQVALTRAGFSVGAIDGQNGPKTRKALAAAGGRVDVDVDALQDYVVSEEDVAGPFEPDVPDDMMEKAKLDTLSYSSIAEKLAERFRTTVPLLERLNPGVTIAAGKTLRVPNVEPMHEPALGHLREVAEPAAEHTAVVRVSKAGRDLKVVDTSGAVRFYAPVSSGSDKDPLPIGEWKVVNVFLRPLFNYNPDLFWDADPSHAKAKLPPGPNGPVGTVWIDLSKEHYGIHGTPEPGKVGHTTSHGCVRLTNWDAERLATLVRKGTEVSFER
jgi:lipoprotein-anchoring transpeptidase ErfK/SrfK